ncbi:probable UBC6 - E2 ubiquitin-conjugating enzyme [Melanopsichium pennsylvanicum]|uniref:Ubiquitin-conjugating enzyme E2 6 n=2 Tax=Melanopsichium pennsylvanicum TaxID=63383 RepID=A0AAJ4XN51_9BASI|nr:probable UBC6-E2 ubiquitin-conjugating enzyme [Melanopsichium pennsylvanicum 4]SNX85655.1 probable UBC6 - E2 ubiquitin-conjugating enzyme [Melanopsichium pennsylvanicum]
MASKAAIKRLTKEAQLMEKDPPPLVYARPREDNILEWHYILRGPPDTPYAGGEYHGQLLFPPEFPFKPPGIKMQTPSGRFAPNTKICTSMSDYHPHTWQPGWNTSTILIGLLSFMCSDEMTTGSVTASDADRRKLAAQSHAFNLTQKKFCQIFPEYADLQIKNLPNMGDKRSINASGADGVASDAAGKTEKVGSDTLASSPASDSAASQGLRNRVSPSTTSAAATNHGSTDADAARKADEPRRRNHGRRDLFGIRSSLVVLTVLAYLFISRVMNASANGIV